LKQRTSRRWLILLLAILLLVAAIPAARAIAQAATQQVDCPPDCMVSFLTPSIMRSASIETGDIQALFTFIMIVAGIVFVLVEAMLVFTVLRHRKRPPEAAVQFHGNTRLEVAWTAAPAVILAVVMGATLQTMGTVRAVSPDNVLNVTVVGHQFWWEFRYPDLGIVTANEMVVPVNTVIELNIESVDVAHSFWAPELFGKTDAVPGYKNRMRFTPTIVRSDYFGGQCAELCGAQHAQMRFAVVVHTPEDFQNWAAHMQREPDAAPTGDAAAGRDVFMTSACVACHAIAGTVAAGQTGPNLTHLASRGFIAGGILANTPANLAAWIRDPQGIKPGNLMPNLALTEEQISDLVAYLTSLQ
jgi:cytochrome c oxidase subunit II